MKSKTVHRGRKFDQVREGAKTIFLRDGYEGASVDEISKAAGVSKATLYSYFPDKSQMFISVMEAQLDVQAATPLDIDEGLPAALAVPRLAREIARLMMADEAADLYRIAIAEAGRFPEMSRDYAAYRGETLRKPLQACLDGLVRRGDLKIDDTALAAEQLILLAGAQIHDRRMLCGERVDEVAVVRASDSAARMFLGAYRAGSAQSSRSAAAQ